MNGADGVNGANSVVNGANSVVNGANSVYGAVGAGADGVDRAAGADVPVQTGAEAHGDAAHTWGGRPQPLRYETLAARDVQESRKRQMAEMEETWRADGSFPRNGESFEAQFECADRVVHMAMSGSEVVGFAVRGPRERGNHGRGKTFMYELHVREDWRGKGIARSLLHMVAHLETPQGARGKRLQVELNVHVKNVNARHVYEHMGFTVPQRNAWVSDEEGNVVAVIMRNDV